MTSYRYNGLSKLECDVLVIGSGAGGATVAKRLTDAGRDVLMIEEGPYLPAAKVPASVPESIKRMWRCGGLTAALGKPPIAYAEGRCVGGGTEINSAIMQRAPPDILDDWAKRYEIRDYGPGALQPYYEQAEILLNATLTEGELGRASDYFKQGGDTLGWTMSALKRAQKKCVGTNLCAAGCPTGGKQSMTATTVPDALSGGMRLIAECRVSRLVVRGRTVSEVKAVALNGAGQKVSLSIFPRHVFVAGGAIHTPALLLRSGIRRNVGKNLRMHPTLRVTAFFHDRVGAEHTRFPLYAVTQFMPDQRLGGSVFMPGFFGMALAEDWANRKDMWIEREHAAMYYAMARGAGKGTVTPLPGLSEPLVRYQCSLKDWLNLQQGLLHLAEITFAAGAKRVFPSIYGHPGWTSFDEARKSLADLLPRAKTNLMAIHLFSSCPPGENARLCATDSYGRVHGLSNVTLADASQIPEAPGVNPQLTVMATALRQADYFLNQSVAARNLKALQEAS